MHETNVRRATSNMILDEAGALRPRNERVIKMPVTGGADIRAGGFHGMYEFAHGIAEQSIIVIDEDNHLATRCPDTCISCRTDIFVFRTNDLPFASLKLARKPVQQST